jgi:hypothetical protein
MSELIFYVATDSDGTLAGFGKTAAWARFDAVRQNLGTCYAMDVWQTEAEGSVMAWGRKLAVSEVRFCADRMDLPLAALLQMTLPTARSVLKALAGLRDQVGNEPPWTILPRERLVSDQGAEGGWWLPLVYEHVAPARRYCNELVIRRLDRDAAGIWRLVGFPVEPGDQLEIRVGVDEARLADVVVSAGSWVAGEVEGQGLGERTGLRFYAPRLGGRLIIGEGTVVVPMRQLGGETTPLLDCYDPVDDEEWRPF